MKLNVSLDLIKRVRKNRATKSLGQFAVALCSLAVYPLMAYLMAYICVRNLATSLIFASAGISFSFVLAWVRFTSSGQSVLTRHLSDRSGTVAVTALIFGFSTAGFSALSQSFFHLGYGSIKGGPFTNIQVFNYAYISYLWHLADAIPLLKIPTTLHWALRHPFEDSLQGGFVIVYTILVIIPFIYLGTQLIGTLSKEAASSEKIARRDEGVSSENGPS